MGKMRLRDVRAPALAWSTACIGPRISASPSPAGCSPGPAAPRPRSIPHRRTCHVARTDVDATVAHVVALSAKHNATISAIEQLQPQGTRVVFMNADDAAVVARAYGTKVLKGAVTRTRWQQRRGS